MQVWDEKRLSDTVVTFVISTCALCACLVLVLGAFIFDSELERKATLQRREHTEPSDYAVMVRGLPKSATVAKVRAHFSDRYDLSAARAAACPVWGMSEFGVAFTSALLATVLAAVVLGLIELTREWSHAAAAGCGLATFLVAFFRRWGKAAVRLTPAEEWDTEHASPTSNDKAIRFVAVRREGCFERSGGDQQVFF